MRTFTRPRVVVSKCLGFARCRYNGAVITDEFVARLKAHVGFVPVCPEMEVGLGCPRDPIRVVLRGGRRRLVQPATGRDLSDEMRSFAARFLDSVGEADGFILKSRSPSCGIKDVKVSSGPQADVPRGVDCGFFGGAVLERFSEVPVEDEGRMNNFILREHFLTRLFATASFRQVLRKGGMRRLVKFHAENKGLLMACNQAQMRQLGRLVANRNHLPEEEVFAAYRQGLARALARPPRPASLLNVLMHALGYVSDGLQAGEKAFFLDTLEKVRAGKVPLSAAATVVRSWGARFGVPYLMEQTFLEPYPEDLLDLHDSGKGRGT
jgi:uncharacterized protein YbgA (DUF1722 family)/uncharacterized protein YbbK (DUF523 family)